MERDAVIDRLLDLEQKDAFPDVLGGYGLTGGKRKKKRNTIQEAENKLSKVDDKLYNAFADKGTLAYKKAEFTTAKKLAKEIMGIPKIEDVTIDQISQVPQSLIDRAMEGYRKERDRQIKRELEQRKINIDKMEVLDKMAKDKKYAAKLEAAAKLDNDDYMKLKYPSEFDLKNVKDDTYKPDPEYAFQPSGITAEQLALFGQGKKKRKPSAYNKFVAQYMKHNKDASLAEAAKAWKNK